MVFMAELLFSLPGIPWPLREAQTLLLSNILSCIMFLELYKASFTKLGSILDESFQPTYVGPSLYIVHHHVGLG